MPAASARTSLGGQLVAAHRYPLHARIGRWLRRAPTMERATTRTPPVRRDRRSSRSRTAFRISINKDNVQYSDYDNGMMSSLKKSL
jgi:hypothetical protein